MKTVFLEIVATLAKPGDLWLVGQRIQTGGSKFYVLLRGRVRFL